MSIVAFPHAMLTTLCEPVEEHDRQRHAHLLKLR